MLVYVLIIARFIFNFQQHYSSLLWQTNDKEWFLSTIQIGITLAGFLGSAFAADNFAQRLADFMTLAFGLSASSAQLAHSVSVIVITLVLSFFTLVLGELVPKRLAMKHKEKLAEAVCGTISGLAFALRPIIWLLTVSTNIVLRLLSTNALPLRSQRQISIWHTRYLLKLQILKQQNNPSHTKTTAQAEQWFYYYVIHQATG